MKKLRLDQLLVERGLAESRAKAQAYIQAGLVIVNDHLSDKAGASFPEDVEIRVNLKTQDVSRGAAKLRSALPHFTINLNGKTAADLGASTGGFTQVLLEQGCSPVHAIDVGYGLLHDSLRNDPRVVIHDRVNVRYLNFSPSAPPKAAGEEPVGDVWIEPVQVATMDLSFIGLELILPAVFRITTEDAECIALVKPQFEAGKGSVGKGGIIRDEKVIQRVLREHVECLQDNGFACWGLVASEVKGKKGNQEYFSWFRKTSFYGDPGPVQLSAATISG